MAKAIEKYYDKYFTTIVYEYRDHRYEVTYPNGSQVCCSPAWVQHRDEQAKIDDMIDNPKPTEKEQMSMKERLEEIWDIMGW